jgi:hypothetical protein
VQRKGDRIIAGDDAEKFEVFHAASDFNLFVHSFGWLSLTSFQRVKPLRT